MPLSEHHSEQFLPIDLFQFVPHFGFRDMLGFSTTPRKRTPVAEASHVVTTRGTLDDSRLAVETALDVSRGLLAVVDHIARVMLIDVSAFPVLCIRCRSYLHRRAT